MSRIICSDTSLQRANLTKRLRRIERASHLEVVGSFAGHVLHGVGLGGGFTQLRIQNPKLTLTDTSKYDFGGISHENAEILF